MAIPRQRLESFIVWLYPLLLVTWLFLLPWGKGVSGFLYPLIMVLGVVQLILFPHDLLERKGYLLIIAGYLLLVLLSLLYTPDIHRGGRIFNQQLLLLIVPLLLILTIDRTTVRKGVLALMAGGVILAAIALYQGIVLHMYRPPTIWHAVHAGNLLLFTMVATLVLLLQRPRPSAVLLLGGALLAQGGALLLNGTRGAWIAFMVAAIILPLHARTLSRRWHIGLSLLLLLAVVTLYQLAPVRAKVANAKSDISLYLQNNASATSLGGRFDMWRAGITMAQRHPLLGVGTGGWETTVSTMVAQQEAPEYILQFNQPHSIYIDAVSSRGFPGLLALLALIGYPLFMAMTAPAGSDELARLLVLGAAIAFLVAGCSDTLLQVRQVFLVYIALTGIGMAMLLKERGMGH
ncbi:MAG TPA: O-antigen ligase family protein [Geobacterales bacterium]|nr:O-antigen ligase family protein [Geobacterales bacterium]